MSRALTSLLLLSLASAGIAQLPSTTLSVSALLEDAIGDPLPGPVDIEFRIYDDPLAGALLWSETQLAVAVSPAGRFQADLGSVVPLDAAVFSTPDRWLTMNPVDGVSYEFIGQTRTVTIAAGEKLFVSATKSLGSMAAGGASGLRLAIGQRIAGSGATPLDNGSDYVQDLRVPQGTRLPFTLSTIFESLPAGT